MALVTVGLAPRRSLHACVASSLAPEAGAAVGELRKALDSFKPLARVHARCEGRRAAGVNHDLHRSQAVGQRQSHGIVGNSEALLGAVPVEMARWCGSYGPT